MIVVDSSALLAIPFQEPEKQAFQDVIAAPRSASSQKQFSRSVNCFTLEFAAAA